MSQTTENQSTIEGWTFLEQEVARTAFDLAQEREVRLLISTLRDRLDGLSSVQAVWDLHDFLSIKRHEIDGKYDYRYPSLLFVFAELVQEGLLDIDELQGLSPDKLAKVRAMSRLTT